MYSWKAIRITCTILLLLPIVHLAYLMSRNAMETLNNSPEAWAREVDAYAAADAGAHLPEHPIVVVGGLRVKLWRHLEDLLAPRPVLMRGLGDAIVEDISFNYERLIGFYQPDTVVLLPGHGEFHIRADKSAEDLVGSIQELAAKDAAHGITRKFYIYTPIKTPMHPRTYPVIDKATQLLRSWASTEPRIVLLETNSLLSDKQGKPKANYFRGDGINLNEHGYLRLSVLLQSHIELDTAIEPQTVALP